MPLSKCPKCEVNYIRPGEKLCPICMRTASSTCAEDERVICSECGENVAVKGCELCAMCLAEKRLKKKRREPEFTENVENDIFATVDEPLSDEPIPENERQEIDLEFGDDNSSDDLLTEEEMVDDDSSALKELDELK